VNLSGGATVTNALTELFSINSGRSSCWTERADTGLDQRIGTLQLWLVFASIGESD
jgi:hypothetical protein